MEFTMVFLTELNPNYIMPNEKFLEEFMTTVGTKLSGLNPKDRSDAFSELLRIMLSCIEYDQLLLLRQTCIDKLEPNVLAEMLKLIDDRISQIEKSNPSNKT